MARLALAGLVGALALTMAPADTWAKKRVVLFDFVGPRSGSFQSQVRSMLRRRATVMRGRVYARAQRKLRIRRGTPRNVRRIAKRIRAVGMVGGVIRKLPRRRYRVRIIVRSGKTGRVVGAWTVTTRGRRLRGQALRVTRANLRVALRRLPRTLGPAGDDDDDDFRRRRRRKPKPKRVVRRGDDDDDDDDDDGGGTRSVRKTKKKADGDDDDDANVKLTDEEKRDLKVRGRGLIVAGGLSVTTRTLAFTFTPGIANPPRGYKGNPVAGAYVTADLFPLGMDMKNKGATRNIGVTFFVDKVIKINSRLKYNDPMTMMEMETDLPTDQLRWGVGAVYRHNFGTKPTDPTVRLSARYNRFTFDIDKTAAPAGVSVDIPNVDYTPTRPHGAPCRLPTGPNRLAICLTSPASRARWS